MIWRADGFVRQLGTDGKDVWLACLILVVVLIADGKNDWFVRTGAMGIMDLFVGKP